MGDPHISLALDLLTSSEPGPGMMMKDCGISGEVSIRLRSVKHVPTARLERRVQVLNQILFTQEGLHAFDGPRRQLIYYGMTLRVINHELNLRRR